MQNMIPIKMLLITSETFQKARKYKAKTNLNQKKDPQVILYIVQNKNI